MDIYELILEVLLISTFILSVFAALWPEQHKTEKHKSK